MEVHHFTIVVALLIPTLISAEYWESPYLKSFAEVQQECSGYQSLSRDTVENYARNGYPDDDCVRELVHCIVLNMNAWNVTTGIKDHVIRQFFKSSTTDVEYRDRTADCLRETVDCLSIRDQVGRSYKSFLCYYRNYGNIVQEPQIVPYTNSLRRKFLVDAFCIKNIPRNVLHRFAAGDIVNNEYFGLILYTYTVRTGLYHPEKGLNFERFFIQAGYPEILSEQTRCCVASVRREYQQEPKRLVETYKQCIQQLEERWKGLEIIQKAAQELIAETPESVLPLTSSSPSCSSCGSPAPCRTCGLSDSSRYHPCYNGQCY